MMMRFRLCGWLSIIVVLGLGCSTSGEGGGGTPPGNDAAVGGTGTGGASNPGTGTGGAAAPGSGGSGGVVMPTDAGTGTGGTPVTPPPETGNSVLERNNHPSRDGHFIQPTLTHAKLMTLAMDAGFNANFAGAMWASPLYAENGPGGKGVFIAATSSNTVYAMDETTGAMVWMATIGPAPKGTGAGCGNLSPYGILSTPVIDAQARTVYVAGGVGTAGIDTHEVHALSLDDGKERAGWPIVAGKVIQGFVTPPQNQRGSLSLVNGILYVPYGGHYGDCGAYKGRVLAIDTKDPTKTGAFSTAGSKSAIWGAGGMASDGNGVVALTGNGGPNTHLPENANGGDSEAAVRVTGLGMCDRTPANYYYPARWQAMDGGDLDFGSNSPVFLKVPGATPASYFAAPSKDGHLYFLDSNKLGGMAGHVFDLNFAAEGMSVHTAPGAYTTAKGAYVVLTTNGARCPNGGGGSVVMGVSVGVTAGAIKPTIAWCAPLGGNMTSPIATTTDGKSDPTVWFMSGANIVGLDGDTGAMIASAGACPGITRWTSPIAVKGRIIAGATGKLCSWSTK